MESWAFDDQPQAEPSPASFSEASSSLRWKLVYQEASVGGEPSGAPPL